MTVQELINILTPLARNMEVCLSDREIPTQRKLLPITNISIAVDPLKGSYLLIENFNHGNFEVCNNVDNHISNIDFVVLY